MNQTWPPWIESFKRAVKVPAGEKSESPKACSRWNWILESESGSENLFRVEGGGDLARVTSGGVRCTPPSNSSSSKMSSSDWNAEHNEKAKRRERANTSDLKREKPIVGLVWSFWFHFRERERDFVNELDWALGASGSGRDGWAWALCSEKVSFSIFF